MSWPTDRLRELVRALAGRPRHEALRWHMTELLRPGFDAPYDESGLLRRTALRAVSGLALAICRPYRG